MIYTAKIIAAGGPVKLQFELPFTCVIKKFNAEDADVRHAEYAVSVDENLSELSGYFTQRDLHLFAFCARGGLANCILMVRA